MSMIKRNVNEQREQIIAMALETAEGRTALAQAMVEPIKTSSCTKQLAVSFLWLMSSHKALLLATREM